MTQHESNAINIARFILVVGILFVHFPISFVAADGINLTESDTPMYNLISSRFFLSDTCLSGLFLLSGYLFFKNIPGEYSEKLYFKKINARLWSICVPYLFWNVFWLVYNLLKTYKLQGAADSDLLEITNISDFFACFWKRGWGVYPDFPIAGYTWYLRDLFIFSLLSPIYNYCYKNRRLGFLLLVILIICESVKGWHMPGMNTWIYIGGFVAYKRITFEQICNRLSWLVSMVAFIIVNYIYYFVIHARVVYILLVIVSFVIIFKISFLAWNSKTLLSLSASSTFLYLTHIFILNVSRHSLAKLLVIDSDMDMCIYYLLNSTLCVIICLGSYFLLKRLKANMLLKVLTGGRA